LQEGDIPILGEVLLGSYDGEFYRGEVIALDTENRTAVLEFFDFGDLKSLGFSTLHAPSKEVMAVSSLINNRFLRLLNRRSSTSNKW
jgi:hypothetical protein